MLKKSFDFLQVLLPYLVYYALRFNSGGDDLPTQIGNFLNSILEDGTEQHIDPILKLFDFLQIACEQDKKLFKDFIE